MKPPVELQQLMKINGPVVIDCVHQLPAHHSGTGQEPLQRQLIPFQGLAHDVASITMHKYFDILYLILASCYHFCQVLFLSTFSFYRSPTWTITITSSLRIDAHDTQSAALVQRCLQQTARLNITSNSSLSRGAYNENSKQDWKSCVGSFPAGVVTAPPLPLRALSTSSRPWLSGMRRLGAIAKPLLFLSLRQYTFFFFFMDPSQSARK